MKKNLFIIPLMVFTGIWSSAQVRLTEVNPLTNNADAKFFELFYNTNVAVDESYYFLVYTRDGGNAPRMFVGKLNLGDKFLKSSGNNKPGLSPGAIVGAQNKSSKMFNKLPADYIYSWAEMFDAANWSVHSYDFAANNGIGSWQIISDANTPLDLFGNYAVNHKIAILLFKVSSISGDPKMVDVVADFSGTAEEIYGYRTLNALGKNFNLNEIKIGKNKFVVNQSLGTNNPYQLVKKNKTNLPSCDLEWAKISGETPGFVEGFNANAISWSVDYFLPLKSSWATMIADNALVLNDDIRNINNATGIDGLAPHFTKIPGDNTQVILNLILGFSNFIMVDNYQNLIVSVYADADGDNNIGSFVNQNNSTQFVYDDPNLVDNTGNELGPYDVTAVNRGLQLVNYVSGNKIFTPGPNPDYSDFFYVDVKIRIPVAFLNQKLFILTGYKSSSSVSNIDYCFGTEKILLLPSALPAQFKTSALKIVDGKARFSWTTSSEQNSKGFEVQRSVGNANEFKAIGFVGSKAKEGNSQTELNYSFDDSDLKAGLVHYYRLNQIDFDGKAMLTPIKSIKPGSIETDLSVYPNPNQGSFLVNASKLSGKVSIFLIDNTGRVLNHFNNVAESTTRISNLKTGFYTLKIVNTETGEQTAQRIVVQ